MQNNRWSGGWVCLSEFQTDGTDTEKARDAKLELTVILEMWRQQ